MASSKVLGEESVKEQNQAGQGNGGSSSQADTSSAAGVEGQK